MGSKWTQIWMLCFWQRPKTMCFDCLGWFRNWCSLLISSCKDLVFLSKCLGKKDAKQHHYFIWSRHKNWPNLRFLSMGEQFCLDMLTVLQEVVNLGDVCALLPEYPSFEWEYPDTSQKWLEEHVFICSLDFAVWLTHFPYSCNSDWIPWGVGSWWSKNEM